MKHPLAIFLSALLCVLCGQLFAAEQRLPNVLLLFADQHNADVMGCAGHPIIKTPNLDQLAAQGVRFTRAYCQDAICVPSRTSLMTGLYPRTTGCLDNGDSPVSQAKLYPLQQVFQSAGYLTGCFGKRHLPRPTLALGWNHSATVIAPNQDPSDENYQDWIQTRGPGQAEAFEKDHKGSLQSDMGCHLSEVKPENRIEAYTALKTKDFLRNCQKQGKNFFCWASFHGPHQPYTPPAQWAALYPVEKMPLPASVDEPIDHLPPGLQNWRRNTKTPWFLAKAAENPALLDDFIAAAVGQDENLKFKSENSSKWSWCDALYMSQPTFARLAVATGDRKYAEYLHKWWWKAADFYYDKEERLYFRDQRMRTIKESNGKQLFWGRGNGWVIGGLVRVLHYLAKEDAMRTRYVDQFKELCEKLVDIQCADGLWRAGLLDPAAYPDPESSGSGFFVYALPYGVNEGLLEKGKYQPAALRGWKGLESCVTPEGKFQNVQPVGDRPGTFAPDSTAPCGTGAFLLAGSDIFRMMTTATPGESIP